ncbi:MAG: hypothetical protein ABJO01_09565 [Parasphingorhabdus sp.]|uniref:hypothetical protein n=1 Tax=Parasphingorhabdus sp. TaxID=2709688 RepID=UPI0032992BDB
MTMDGPQAALLKDIMPEMMKHEGQWVGTYLHVDPDNNLIDQHDAEISCIFPNSGPYGYVQKNLFQWPDGRKYRSTLNGVLRDGKLWWDNDQFSGCAWETEYGLVLLNLERKDDPGARFFEIICLGEDGNHRARTWQWFKNGKLFKRTLCNEQRVSA